MFVNKGQNLTLIDKPHNCSHLYQHLQFYNNIIYPSTARQPEQEEEDPSLSIPVVQATHSLYEGWAVSEIK